MKIFPVDEKFEYGCSPCWVEHQRDTDAVVYVETDLSFGCFSHTYLCGNHAELLSDSEETAKEERK